MGKPTASDPKAVEQSMHEDRSLSQAIDHIRDKYGFTSIQRGLTFALHGVFREEHGHFILKTPALSRW